MAERFQDLYNELIESMRLGKKDDRLYKIVYDQIVASSKIVDTKLKELIAYNVEHGFDRMLMLLWMLRACNKSKNGKLLTELSELVYRWIETDGQKFMDEEFKKILMPVIRICMNMPAKEQTGQTDWPADITTMIH